MENSQLTITDMMSIRNIIDAACSRGAFKANEMQSIGEVYNKLNVFIELVQAQAQAAEQAQADMQTAAQPGEANA